METKDGIGERLMDGWVKYGRGQGEGYMLLWEGLSWLYVEEVLSFVGWRGNLCYRPMRCFYLLAGGVICVIGPGGALMLSSAGEVVP